MILDDLGADYLQAKIKRIRKFLQRFACIGFRFGIHVIILYRKIPVFNNVIFGLCQCWEGGGFILGQNFKDLWATLNWGS